MCACVPSPPPTPQRGQVRLPLRVRTQPGATSQLSPEQPVTTQESDTILLSHLYGQ